jgi:hypothetical protein
MCFRRGGRRRKSISDRRAERVLFFWTARELIEMARELLKFAGLLALAVYALVSLAEGKLPPGVEALAQLIHDL